MTRIRVLLWALAALVAAAFAIGGPVPTNKPAHFPSWWFERDVIPRLPEAANKANPVWPQDYPASDDYAVANQGQVKHIAKQAFSEFQAKLPNGAGSALAGQWANPQPGTDDYAAINLGQLKAVAKPFYDRLIAEGVIASYPWQNGGVADDYAAANIGQLKYTFAFTLGTVVSPPLATLINQYVSAALAIPVGVLPVYAGSAVPPAAPADQAPNPGGAPGQLPSYLPGSGASPLQPPSNLRITVLNAATAPELGWSGNYHTYTVQRRTGGIDGDWVSVANVSGNAWTDTALSAGVLYEYRVIGKTADNKSSSPSRVRAYDVPAMRLLTDTTPYDYSNLDPNSSYDYDAVLNYATSFQQEPVNVTGHKDGLLISWSVYGSYPQYWSLPELRVGIEYNPGGTKHISSVRKVQSGPNGMEEIHESKLSSATLATGFLETSMWPGSDPVIYYSYFYVRDASPFFISYRGSLISSSSIPPGRLEIDQREAIGILTNYSPARSVSIDGVTSEGDARAKITWQGGGVSSSVPYGSPFEAFATVEFDLEKDTNGEASLTVTNNGDVINPLTKTIQFKTVFGDATSPANVPLSESSGAKYRKIALNGAPLSDEKPQQAEESDQPREETFVDALTLGLRHDTTDVYHKVPNSDLFLGVRRSTAPEIWNKRRGALPNERPDRPFGAGWSSNLAAGIEFSRAVGSASPTAQNPDTATVTDENGVQYTFAILYSDSDYSVTNGFTGARTFVPLPSSRNEQDAFLCTLEEVLNKEGGTNERIYVFKRKFGTICVYKMSALEQALASDLIDGSSSGRHTTYARLSEVVDRYGNKLEYEYQSGYTLIPRVIRIAPSGAEIKIRQNESGLVTDVWDANGYHTHYEYQEKDGDAWVLSSVEAPRNDDQPLAPKTEYTYERVVEPDQSPDGVDPHHEAKIHLSLTAIKDPRGSTYTFEYAFDHTKRDLYNGEYYVKTGLPRTVKKVILPDNNHATFSNEGSIVRLGEGKNPEDGLVFDGVRKSTVVDARGNERVYEFGDAEVESMENFQSIYTELGPAFDAPRMIFYKEMKITSYAGKGDNRVEIGWETFTFNIDAGMALASVTDFSGNTTSYTHDDVFTNSWRTDSGLTGTAFGRYSDPTSQTNADGTKHFEYGQDRIMTSQIDERGVKTVWQLDDRGTADTHDDLPRRTDEWIYPTAESVSPVAWTHFDYGDSRFPGFVTRKTVKKLAGEDDPEWVADLVTQYVADDQGRLWKEIVDPAGLALTTTHTYDAAGNKITTTDPRNNKTTFSYDRRNRLTHVTYADSTQRRIFYDLRGNKIREDNENGHSTLWVYDALNRVRFQAIDMNRNHQIDGLAPDGTGSPDRSVDLITTYGYNALNARTFIIDPRSAVTTFEYDSIGRLVRKVEDYGLHSNNSNYTTTYQYDGEVVGLPALPVEYAKYVNNCGGSTFDSSAFKPRLITDPRGYRTRIVYDPLGRPVYEQVEYAKSPAPAYAVTRKVYDEVGNLSVVIAPAVTAQTQGVVTYTEYDALRRPWRVTQALGTELEATTTTYFTSTGLAHRVVDPLGHDTLTKYDAAGRPRYVYGPLVPNALAAAGAPAERPVTETIYDDAGNVSAVVNPLGHRTDYGYDERNRRVTETLPAVHDATAAANSPTVRPLRTTVYDLAGRPVAVQDARGAVTLTRYDDAGRVREVESPGVLAPDGVTVVNPLVKTTPDANGNAVEVTDANGHLIRNRYDALNRLVETRQYLDQAAAAADATTFTLPYTDTRLISTRYAYDASGNRTDVWDGKNQHTRFTYDGLNRLLSTIDPADRSVRFEYDAVNKTARVDSEERRTEYDYDERNRLWKVRYIGRSADNRTYAYDALNRILAVTETGKPSANVAYTYDALGRIETETSHGLTHTYRYDLANNRTHATYGGTGTKLLSQYDALNRLEALAEYPGGNSPARTTTYGYDLNGNTVEKQLPNGDLETTRHDGLNRRITTTVTRPGGALVLALLQRYDPAGNVVQIREEQPGLTPRVVTNVYDDANRLTDEVIDEGSTKTIATAYEYDQANNRVEKEVDTTQGGATTTVTTIYAYNNLNQLQTATTGAAVTSFTYDDNGNRLTRTLVSAPNAPPSETDTYAYDYENRLTTLTKALSSQPSALSYSYLYDYRTRRVSRLENGATTSVVFSGGVSVAEYSGGTTSVSSALTAEYIRGSDWGGGVGGLLYSVRAGSPSFKHYNSRGDVISETNASGVATWQGAYEAFGKRTQEVGTSQDRQRANTKEEDPTGLLNEGFRYRDLETGVFITRDPLGFVDGPNMYAYVVQNPWSKFDPEGLQGSDYNKRTQDEQKRNVQLSTTEQVAAGTIKTLAAVPMAAAQLVTQPVQTAKAVVEQTKQDHADGGVLGVANRYNPVAAAAGSISGHDPINGRELSVQERTEGGLAAAASLVPIAGAANKLGKLGKVPDGKVWSRTPQTLQDQMSLEAAQKGAGAKIIDNLGDKNFKGMEKWEYKVKSSEGRDSVVHYVRDPKTSELMDFKFKKHSNDVPTLYERTPEPSVSSGNR